MSNTPKLSFLQRVALGTLWTMCRGFAIMPHFVRYGIFANFTYFILCYVLRYRRKVILDNLHRSFPDYDEKKIMEICRGSYRNLAEQIINTIGQAGISEQERLRRMKFTNMDEVCKELNGRSAVMLTAHFGPWEAAGAVSLTTDDHQFVAVYHQIKSPVFDELLRRIRQHSNLELVEMKRTMRYFIENIKQRPLALCLIADQNPPKRANIPWYKFLHQWTAFFDGGEMLATKYQLPVYYFTTRRVKAGYYEGTFTQIHDGVEPVEPYTITERYVRHLEQDIIRTPEMWMWTHRRWKKTPPPELLAQKI